MNNNQQDYFIYLFNIYEHFEADAIATNFRGQRSTKNKLSSLVFSVTFHSFAIWIILELFSIIDKVILHSVFIRFIGNNLPF